MKPILALSLFAFGAMSALADDAPQANAEAAVRAADAAFWKAYNTCDIPATGDFFTESIEFYHDKGGLTKSRADLVESIKKNICGNPAQRVRREAVAGSVQFYPMAGNRALLVGDHKFYITEPGKPEYVTGQAKFDDLWEYADGHWRMSRVFSYSHGGVPYAPPEAIDLPADMLAKLVGRYSSKQSGDVDVAIDGDHLKLTAGAHTFALSALSPTQFFVKERDLRFEFSAPTAGRAVDRIFVRENGSVTDTALRKSGAPK